MAITSIVGKTRFKASWGKARVPLFAEVSQGDLIAVDVSNNGWILADASTGIPATRIAMEDGIKGDTIWSCSAAVVSGLDTETSGVFTDNYIAEADDVTKTLYVGESGDILLSAGTIAQVVGYILSRTEFFLCPSAWLTGVNISASGTLAVTGTSTLSGAVTTGSTSDLSAGKTTVDDVDVKSGGVIAGLGTGANGVVLKNLKNDSPTALSGDQKDIEIDIDGTAYYFTVYPTKAS
jgi:hypothetical protein